MMVHAHVGYNLKRAKRPPEEIGLSLMCGARNATREEASSFARQPDAAAAFDTTNVSRCRYLQCGATSRQHSLLDGLHKCDY